MLLAEVGAQLDPARTHFVGRVPYPDFVEWRKQLGGVSDLAAYYEGTLNLSDGGEPERFAPFAQLFRRAAATAGHDPIPAFSINSHGFLADSSQEAADLFFPPYAEAMTRIGRERGWPPVTRAQFERSRAPDGAFRPGTPGNAPFFSRRIGLDDEGETVPIE